VTPILKLDGERSGDQPKGRVRRVVKLIVGAFLLMAWLAEILTWEARSIGEVLGHLTFSAIVLPLGGWMMFSAIKRR
jgi:hypothetical protein